MVNVQGTDHLQVEGPPIWRVFRPF